MTSADYGIASAQFLRAVRGQRSQRAFARRFGFSGNPVTDWEHQRRHPTAKQVLTVLYKLKLPVDSAFVALHPTVLPERKGEEVELGAWLQRLRGRLPLQELAARTGRSRFAVSRWLSSKSELKLHEFFLVVDAITGRLHEWAFQLVAPSAVPELEEAHDRARAAKGLALERPWTEAILRVLETRAYRSLPQHSSAFVSATLGIPETLITSHLQELVSAGIVQEGRLLEVVGALNVDTASAPDALRRLKRHWASVGSQRISAPSPDDWSAYNVISVSEKDLERIRQRLSEAYREIRSIVAASEPTECAALILLQVVAWPPAMSADEPSIQEEQSTIKA